MLVLTELTMSMMLSDNNKLCYNVDWQLYKMGYLHVMQHVLATICFSTHDMASSIMRAKVSIWSIEI